MRQLLLISILLLAGCGDQTAKSWVGNSEGSLYSSWGAPDRSQSVTGGGKVVTFTGRNYMGQPVCQSSFMISPTGVVASAKSNCM